MLEEKLINHIVVTGEPWKEQRNLPQFTRPAGAFQAESCMEPLAAWTPQSQVFLAGNGPGRSAESSLPGPGTLRGFDYPYLYFYLPSKLLLLGAGTDLVFLLEDFKRSEKYNKIKQALLGRHLPQGAVPVTAQH